MKPWMKWTVTLVVLGVALSVAGVKLKARQDAKAQAEQAALAARAQAPLELAASDVVRAQLQTLAQGLPVSGTIRAVNSAMVKARVAGELSTLSVREGDTVKAGQVIGRIDTTEYQARQRQAQQQADSAKAQIDIAKRQYDNNKALVDQGFISKTALDTSQANLQSAQANYNAAMAAVDLARKAMDDTVVRSPIAGLVAQRLAQAGERVGIDARIIEVIDLSRLEVEANLSPADSLSVQVGQSATLGLQAQDPSGATGSARRFTARVSRINPSLQAGSRNVIVYLAIDEPAGLRQGLFVQGTLGTASTSALAIPLSTVRTDKPTPYVQTVENGRIVHRSVELGARGTVAGDTLVAVSNVPADTLVISGTLGSLREGTPVKFTAATPKTAP